MVFADRLDSGPARTAAAELADRARQERYAQLSPLFKELADLDVADPQRAAVRAELVAGYLPVAQHIARRFAGRGEPYDDLVQAGTLGLLGAIDRFEPARGLDFLSFAVPTITGEIRRHFRDHTWATHVPRRLRDLQSTLNAAIGPLTQELGRAPRPTEVADRLDLPLAEVLEGLTAQQAYRNDSLDQITTSASHTSPLERIGRPDGDLTSVEDREAVNAMLETLPERERTIVVLRFYGNRTQSQIAEVIGVSQMHVSRLLDRTLKALRAQLTG